MAGGEKGVSWGLLGIVKWPCTLVMNSSAPFRHDMIGALVGWYKERVGTYRLIPLR